MHRFLIVIASLLLVACGTPEPALPSKVTPAAVQPTVSAVAAPTATPGVAVTTMTLAELSPDEADYLAAVERQYTTLAQHVARFSQLTTGNMAAHAADPVWQKAMVETLTTWKFLFNEAQAQDVPARLQPFGEKYLAALQAYDDAADRFHEAFSDIGAADYQARTQRAMARAYEANRLLQEAQAMLVHAARSRA